MSLFWLAMLVANGVWAGPAAEVEACLDRYDLRCATAAAKRLGDDPADRVAAASIEFSMGEFAAAHKSLAGVASTYADDERYQSQLDLYQKSEAATLDFSTLTRGDVTLRYRPGMDDVLVDEAFDTLQATHDRVGPVLGGAPPGGIRIELYPTAQRFIDASSLPGTAVRTTGVIALSKWTRLLVSSPRALGHGYAWRDTIAHEYIHYIVAWRTLDKAPVWLHEGIARSHEALWSLDEPAALSPTQQSLLADALANDALVPLARMHPSMAFLKSADEAALAFAQVSTMMVYLRQNSGPQAVSQVLDLVREGRDALQAVADVGAAGDADAFMAGWRASLEKMDLVSKKLAASAVVLDGAADEFASDPVLSRRFDLARSARLGDLLLDAGYPDAALVEYAKAISPEEGTSPVLAVRTARALIALGKETEAKAALAANIADYPEYAGTRSIYANLLMKVGDRKGAMRHFRAAVDIDPFDPASQAAIADLYSAAGDVPMAERHARYARILQSSEPVAATR